MSEFERFQIDAALAGRLIASQFPQWAHLPITPVEFGGWDNKTFHLGQEMSIRLPTHAVYCPQVEKEHHWLPLLAPHLPLPVPNPIAKGHPGEGFPWPWSIYQWLGGNSVAKEPISDLCQCAIDLAQFLRALRQIDATNGPIAGAHNFYRGGPLMTYDIETRKAIALLGRRIDADAVVEVWNNALTSTWQGRPVWVHGDVAAGNLLVEKGKLSAVIDFGSMGVGDPACDLVIAWTLFKDENRDTFRATLSLDDATWGRGRGWSLWKALIVAAGLTSTKAVEGQQCWQIIYEILEDHKRCV